MKIAKVHRRYARGLKLRLPLPAVRRTCHMWCCPMDYLRHSATFSFGLIEHRAHYKERRVGMLTRRRRQGHLPPPSPQLSLSFSQPASQPVSKSTHFQTLRESAVNLRPPHSPPPPRHPPPRRLLQDGYGRISSLPKESIVFCRRRRARSRERDQSMNLRPLARPPPSLLPLLSPRCSIYTHTHS